MIVFGGVVDKEQMNHMVDSVFYNDLMVMDIGRRNWFPLRVKDKDNEGAPRRRRRKNNDDQLQNEEESTKIDEENLETDDSSSEFKEEEDQKEEADDDQNRRSGWDLDMLRSNMFAFIDGDGNIVYEKIHDDKPDNNLGEPKDDDEDEEEKREKDLGTILGAKETDKEEVKEEELEKANKAASAKKRPMKSNYESQNINTSSVMVVNEETNAPEPLERTEPLPRINASILARGHVVYVLGGILEVGDREITLDDMWALDIRKHDKWQCLWGGTFHKQVWRGATYDDDDSYISTRKEDGTADGDDVEEDDDDFSEDDTSYENTRESRKKKRSDLRQEVAELNTKYRLGESSRTPREGETLADFYSRTSEYWNNQAAKEVTGTDADLSNKELKRKAFFLAEARFKELEPILSQLGDLKISETPAEHCTP